MNACLQESSFSRLSPAAARAVLLVIVATAALFVGVTLRPAAGVYMAGAERGPSDFLLYRAEVSRMRSGAGYYDAIERELETRGYPTRSVFNWRTPLPVWLFGKVASDQLPALALQLGGLLLIAGATLIVAREHRSMAAWPVALVFVGGAVMPTLLEPVYLLAELWAGILIGLSLVAYGLKRSTWGTLLGVAALFVRELAAPYCLVSLVLAVHQRRKREAVLWLVGLGLYAAYFALHVWQVLPRIDPGARVPQGWLHIGGIRFLVGLAQMNAWLINSPVWVAAIYLVVALMGWASWNTPLGQRVALSGCAFLALFALIGQPFNQYWGSILAPLLALGAAQFPKAIADLWRRARPRAEASDSMPTAMEPA